MATQSWSSVVDHSSDAAFRAWGSELSGKLAAAGLVQTSDTGQINWTTVTRPGANTAAGYEIWRFNDSLQSSAPIYIKLEYGTSAASTRPGAWITVGTGTNGAGTITGVASTRTTIHHSAGPVSTSTAYPSYLCVAEGFAGLLWKHDAGASGISLFFFAVCRSVDTSGAPTTTGCYIYMKPSAVGPCNTAALRFTGGGYTVANNTSFCAVPGALTTSVDDSGNYQAYINFFPTPTVRPNLYICTTSFNDFSFATTFSVALIGSTPHTYIHLAGSGGYGSISGTPSNYSLAMLWE